MTSETEKFDSKRDFVRERLQLREEDRQATLEKKRLEKENVAVENEKAGYFSQMFGQAKASLQTKLDDSSQMEKSSLPHHFDTISLELQKLQKFLADSILFLPSYDVRVSQASLKSLQEQLQDQKNTLLPKKKFTFKPRKKESGRKAEIITETDSSVVDKVLAAAALESCGFQDSFGQELRKTEDELENQNVGLYRLKECDVFLFGCPITVHMSALSKCRIFCGPVKTSVFVDNCLDCTFIFACQQLRAHTTTGSDFYLHVTSNPIVEDCSSVRFAPYNLSYTHLDKHFELAELNSQLNRWQQVNDFNWLAADVPSPNWSVIPEDERVANWDVDAQSKTSQVDLPV